MGDAFDLDLENGTSYYREPDGAAAWRTFSEGYGLVHTLARKLDSVQRCRFEAEFTAFHDGLSDALGITVPRQYRVVRGVLG